MSQRDFELARQISAAARELGVSADPTAVQAEVRVAAVSAAGGHLVTDQPRIRMVGSGRHRGHEACVATWMDRD